MEADKKIIADIVARLEKLEDAIFNKSPPNILKKPLESTYKGLAGGLQKLLDEEYFKTMRSTNDVRATLAADGYRYQRPVIQTSLNRLANKKGPLVAFKENGVKVYAIRK